jgi:hypothetical protein
MRFTKSGTGGGSEVARTGRGGRERKGVEGGLRVDLGDVVVDGPAAA